MSPLIDLLKTYNCGNHSCYFSKNNIGTNGPCSCLGNIPLSLKIAILKEWEINKKGNSTHE